jgi:TusE/DsrC/DsvC family sulfur relay protein
LKELIGVPENDVETQTAADEAIPETPARVNERGFMVSPSRWTPGVAWFLARRQGVANWPRGFTSEHWQVIHYTRAYYRATGNAPSLRFTCRALGLTKEQLYRLFPSGLMTVRRISGLPGPRRTASGRELSIAQQLLASNWWRRLTGAELPNGRGAGRRGLLAASPVPDQSSRSVKDGKASVAVEGTVSSCRGDSSAHATSEQA